MEAGRNSLGFGVLGLAVFLAGCSSLSSSVPAGDERVVEDVCEFDRDPQPEGLSGISCIGGDHYFCVDDRGGLLHEVEMLLGEEGDVESFAVKRSIRLEGRVDLEGCAYDPLDGRIWVSDEHDTSVRQFDPETGKETARVDLPEV